MSYIFELFSIESLETDNIINFNNETEKLLPTTTLIINNKCDDIEPDIQKDDEEFISDISNQIGIPSILVKETHLVINDFEKLYNKNILSHIVIKNCEISFKNRLRTHISNLLNEIMINNPTYFLELYELIIPDKKNSSFPSLKNDKDIWLFTIIISIKFYDIFVKNNLECPKKNNDNIFDLLMIKNLNLYFRLMKIKSIILADNFISLINKIISNEELYSFFKLFSNSKKYIFYVLFLLSGCNVTHPESKFIFGGNDDTTIQRILYDVMAIIIFLENSSSKFSIKVREKRKKIFEKNKNKNKNKNKKIKVL